MNVFSQVIDSVLYDASSSTGAIGTMSLSYTTNAASVNFNISGNSGTVTIYKADGSTVCSAAACNSVPKASVPTGTSVYARDASGNYSQTTTVTY